MGNIGNERKILVMKTERKKKPLSKPSCKYAKSIKRDSEQNEKAIKPTWIYLGEDTNQWRRRPSMINKPSESITRHEIS